MVETLVLPVQASAPESEAIARAAAVLQAGGLVAFPTETVYGLGANALDAQAASSIFRAKDRPVYDPLIVHLADGEDLPIAAAQVSAVARELAACFWPGPLTLVLPRAPRIPTEVTSGGETVAVRVPAHPVAQALIRAAGVPVAAPSANRFGRISPTRAEHVLADLAGRVDVILDGGPTPVGVESTVLSLVMPVPTILRPGGISREALVAILGEVRVLEPITPETETAPAPGMALQHYAPRAPLTLFRGEPAAMLAALRDAAQAYLDAGERVGLLLADEDGATFRDLPVTVQCAGPSADVTRVAQQLFASLRALDRAGVSIILARDFGAAGLGLAIRDRLTRAAAGDVVRVA